MATMNFDSVSLNLRNFFATVKNETISLSRRQDRVEKCEDRSTGWIFCAGLKKHQLHKISELIDENESVPRYCSLKFWVFWQFTVTSIYS